MITGKWQLLASNDLALYVGTGVVLQICDRTGASCLVFIPGAALYPSKEDADKFVIGKKQGEGRQ